MGPASHLSAAQGAAFDGRLLASCGSDPRARVAVLLDVQTGKSSKLGPPAMFDVATITRGGESVMVQPLIAGYPGGIPEVHAAVNYFAGRMGAPDKGTYGGYGWLYQCGPGDLWFGDRLYAGAPASALTLEGDTTSCVPDLRRNMVYQIGKEELSARRADLSLANRGKRALAYPPSHGRQPTDFYDRKRFIRPLAVTHGEDLYLYVISESILLRAQTAAFTEPGNIEGATGRRTAGDPASFEQLATNRRVSATALSSDGTLFLTAHQSEGVVMAWDVRTGRKIAEVKCPAPRFLLVLGSHVYAANWGKGTISVIATDTWCVVNEVLAGGDDVYHLVAPAAAAFDGRLACSFSVNENHLAQVIARGGINFPFWNRGYFQARVVH